MRKGINISHVNMGGHDQSQVNIKFEKSLKKVSPFQKNIPKSHNDDTACPVECLQRDPACEVHLRS